MRISRNVLFVVVDDDDNDKTSMKRKKGCFRAMEGSSGHAWKENSKFGRRKKSLVFSLPRTRRPDSVSRTWAVFDENSKLACIDSYWNQSFWSLSRPSITFPATAGERDREIKGLLRSSNYSCARWERAIPIGYLYFPGPVRPPSLRSL